MIKKYVASPSILLVFIILVGLYHFFGYRGHFGFDDLHYAELASGLLHGNINLEDHYAYRFTVVFLTSLSYWIFGISDFSSSLPALLITFTILITVFNILRSQGPAVSIIGLSICTFSNWLLFYSDKLMPDIYVALSVILALALINHFKYKSDKRRPLAYAFLLTASLLFGFLSKGTVVLVIPLLIYLVITDIILKRDLKFWLYSVVTGIGLLVIYFFFIWLLTGDLAKRFDAIAHNSYLNLCSYDQQSLRILLKRILTGFFGLTIYQSLATGFIFVFAVLFQRRSPNFFRLDDSFSFFLVSSVILFFSSNFMTISPAAYSPMCLDPRHYLFLVPVVAIPASTIIFDFFTRKNAAFPIIISLWCITIISWFLEGSTFWKLYLPLSGLFSFHYFTRITKQVQHLFVLLIAIILLLIPVEMIAYARQVKYRKQRKLITEQVLDKRQGDIIVSDEVQVRLLNYYTGFDAKNSCRFLTYSEFEADTSTGGTKLMLLNDYTRYLSGMDQQDLPYYARHVSPLNRLIFEDTELHMALYELKELTIPGNGQYVLVSSLNDFEDPVPCWNQTDRDISIDRAYAGRGSNLVSAYSSTFDYPLDSLQLEDSTDLLVRCRLFCNVADKSGSKLIVSMENREGSHFWEALDIDRFIKAYSNWWPVSFDVSIPREELFSLSRLKVYVWNKELQTIYIDNFEVSILAIPASSPLPAKE